MNNERISPPVMSRRSIQVLADRAVPVLELIARSHSGRINYATLAALITRPGETVVSAQIIGKVIGHIATDSVTGGYPDKPWAWGLGAFVVLRETDEVAEGWTEHLDRLGISCLNDGRDITPHNVRKYVYGAICTAWMGEDTVAEWPRFQSDISAAG